MDPRQSPPNAATAHELSMQPHRQSPLNAAARQLLPEAPLPCREKRIRTLGWDGLDVTAEELIVAIGASLASLNHTYEVHADSAVVILPAHEQRAKLKIDDLVVQFLVQQSEGGFLNLDIRRLRGNSFRFHALYREFRQLMAGINGWDEGAGEYRAVRRRAGNVEERIDAVPSPKDSPGFLRRFTCPSSLSGLAHHPQAPSFEPDESVTSVPE